MAAEVYLYVFAPENPASGLRSPMMALVNGMGNSPLAVAIGLTGGIFARIVPAIFPGVFCHSGILGFRIGDAAANFAPFLIGWFYFWIGMRKRRKTLTEL